MTKSIKICEKHNNKQKEHLDFNDDDYLGSLTEITFFKVSLK